MKFLPSYTFDFRRYYARQVGRRDALPPGLPWFEAIERQRQRQGWIRAFINRRLIPDDLFQPFLQALAIYISYIRDHLKFYPNASSTLFAPNPRVVNSFMPGDRRLRRVTYRAHHHRLVPDMAILLDVDNMNRRRYWSVFCDAIGPIEYHRGSVIIYVGDYCRRRHLQRVWREYPDTYLRLDHATFAATRETLPVLKGGDPPAPLRKKLRHLKDGDPPAPLREKAPCRVAARLGPPLRRRPSLSSPRSGDSFGNPASSEASSGVHRRRPSLSSPRSGDSFGNPASSEASSGDLRRRPSLSSPRSGDSFGNPASSEASSGDLRRLNSGSAKRCLFDLKHWPPSPTINHSPFQAAARLGLPHQSDQLKIAS